MKTIQLFALLLLTFHEIKAEDLPEFPFIYILGHASRQVAPDMANLSVSISEESEDYKASLTELRALSAQLVKLLQSKGESITMIRTDAINSYDHFDHDQKLNLHVSSREFDFIYYDLEHFEKFYNELLELDESIDIAFDFTVSEKNLIEKELLAEAIENAKKEAVQIAEQIDGNLLGVHGLSKAPMKHLPDYFTSSGMMVSSSLYDKGESAQLIDIIIPEKIDVETRVHILFEFSRNANKAVDSTR